MSEDDRLAVQPGSVPRLALIDRLRQATSRPVISVAAPAGYGKTTMLSQWAERSDRLFAWLTVREGDNDPQVLLAHIAAALDALAPAGQPASGLLAAPGNSVPGSVASVLGPALASMTTPMALVLDDVHVLHDPRCRAAVLALADYVPGGSHLVLAGRDRPPVPVARLRTAGKIVEIGPRDLALSRAEAASLLHEAGISVGEYEVAELHSRTEGWPAGLYLAALSLRAEGSQTDAVASFSGEQARVRRYLEATFLTRISPAQRAFLTRTSALQRICGPLCDVALRRRGSAATLADLARSNLLLVPLDRRGTWYRYHHLLRDLLLAEVTDLEPELVPVLRRRAAAWCQRNGLPEEALEYSIAAEDADTAAALAAGLVVRARGQGRVATVQRWLRWLDDRGQIEKRPMLAALAGIVSALAGRTAEAERWADAADRCRRDGSAVREEDPAAEAWAAVLRGMLCRGGIAQLRADADEAARWFAAAGGKAPPVVALEQGIARILSGDLDGGDAFIEDALGGAEADAHEVSAIALCERSLVAMARGEWSRAAALGGQARAVLREAGIAESYLTPLVCAVLARSARHAGDIPAARRELASAQRARQLLADAIPPLAVQAQIELARVCIALTDVECAKTLLREAGTLLGRRPGMGTLTTEAEALLAQLSGQRELIVPGALPLTAAELRLLPVLATHLSFREIAEQLGLSRSTVKVEATSIYRKVGAASRHEAVTRARDLGLLDG